jgi:hypothetical protein
MLRPMAGGALSLGCRCGSVSGVLAGVSPNNGNHVVCYCDDCQAFATFLGGADILDDRSGTEIYQTTPSRVQISSGASNIRCMRLTEKGMLRWYAACCRTPIANTLSRPRIPFAGLVRPFFGDAPDGRSRDAVLGEVTLRAFGRYAKGGMPPGATDRPPLSFFLRITRLMLTGFVTGAHRPSPFFDERGDPVALPEVLSREQRARLAVTA